MKQMRAIVSFFLMDGKISDFYCKHLKKNPVFEVNMLFFLISIFLFSHSRFAGSTRLNHHTSAVSGTYRYGPDQDCPAHIHTGAAFPAGDVCRLFCSSRLVCQVGKMSVFVCSSRYHLKKNLLPYIENEEISNGLMNNFEHSET